MRRGPLAQQQQPTYVHSGWIAAILEPDALVVRDIAEWCRDSPVGCFGHNWPPTLMARPRTSVVARRRLGGLAVTSDIQGEPTENTPPPPSDLPGS